MYHDAVSFQWIPKEPQEFRATKLRTLVHEGAPFTQGLERFSGREKGLFLTDGDDEIHIISHYFHILEIIWFLFLILRWKSQGAMNSYDLCLKCSLCFCNFKGGCVSDGASPFVIGIQNGADHDGICSTSGPSTMTNSSLYYMNIVLPHRRYQIF